MSLLFDLDDFEETRLVWELLYETAFTALGWHWALEDGWQVPLHEDGTPVTKAEWKNYLGRLRCRDCGGEMKSLPSTMGCGGARPGLGSFELCDGCARVDGLEPRQHHAARCDPRPALMSMWTAAAVCTDCTWDVWTEKFSDGFEVVQRTDAEIQAAIDAHNQSFWSGRWGGVRLTRAEADRLLAEQSERRAKYLRTVAA